MHDATGLWVNSLGGTLVLALGITVLFVRPRTRRSLWFGIFAIGFGGQFTVGNALQAIHGSDEVRRIIAAALALLWMVACLGLALVFPRAVRPIERRLYLAAAAVALVAIAAAAPNIGLGTGLERVELIMFPSSLAALLGLLTLLALRFRAANDAGLQREMALAAGALTVYVAYVAGYGRYGNGQWGVLHADGAAFAFPAVFFIACLGIAAIWLSNIRGPGARMARNLGLLTLCMILVGLGMAAWTPTPGGHGVTRILMVMVFGYAILRHQILGLDVKIRWGISKTTLAGIFVAVFFVASEAAQEFFGTALENDYVGIIAAGLLVFAIAPLSRFADKVAERAVPVADPVADRPAAAETTYSDTVKRLLRDGRLDRDDERLLAALAADLGLDPRCAFEIRDDVERQLEAWDAQEEKP